MGEVLAWLQQTAALIDTLKGWTQLLADGIEIAAALVIGIAAVEALVRSLALFVQRNSAPGAKEDTRLRLGRWLAVALEFELGADILRTAVTPDLTRIGQLAAIAAIRTALNYFLQKEIDRAAARQVVNPTADPTSQERQRAYEGPESEGPGSEGRVGSAA
jgi:uncharacterized membrane protein